MICDLLTLLGGIVMLPGLILLLEIWGTSSRGLLESETVGGECWVIQESGCDVLESEYALSVSMVL